MELAPNLFNSYEAWLENYRYMLARDPTHDELSDAELYFRMKEKAEAGGVIARKSVMTQDDVPADFKPKPLYEFVSDNSRKNLTT